LKVDKKMCFVFSKKGLTKIWITAILGVILISSVIGAYELSRLSSPSPSTTITPTPTSSPSFTPSQVPNTPIQTPTLTPPVSQDFINVTGYAQYELSQTEFVFVTATKTYNVTMDITTQTINLNGKLLGGYQIVSVLIPLQLTVSGILNGTTIMAQTVIIPTTKDRLT
jgi:hypothetical protein